MFRLMPSVTKLKCRDQSREADVERLQSILATWCSCSPRSGRVQYRFARAGEVIAPGQRIFTILDLKTST